MLIGFSVGNFKSFKDHQTFLLSAGRISRHSNHIIDKSRKKILKGSLIYGANAGGKSNLINAFDFSCRIIRFGMDQVNLNKMHFRINRSMYDEPGYFEYDIIVGDKEYVYGIAISYSKKIILGEWLIRKNKNGDELYIYNREEDNGKSYVTSEYDQIGSEEDAKMLNILLCAFGDNISDFNKKKTILSDIAQRYQKMDGAIGEIQDVFNWLTGILIIYPNTQCSILEDITTQENIYNEFIDMLSGFDTGIESIQVSSQVMDFDNCASLCFPGELVEKIKVDFSNAQDSTTEIVQIGGHLIHLHKRNDGSIVYNKILLSHGNEDAPFDFEDESDGTQRLITLLSIFQMTKKPHLILIDDINRSLHTILTRKYLELFYSRTEGLEIQLIATTHDTNLMDLHLMRQDEYWFVEKERDQSSHIYSLDVFKERFDKKINKEYLIGRYGAIPIFKESLDSGD